MRKPIGSHPNVDRRREGAIQRLEFQLQSGMKRLGRMKSLEPLSASDKERIGRDIAVLRGRLGRVD